MKTEKISGEWYIVNKIGNNLQKTKIITSEKELKKFGYNVIVKDCMLKQNGDKIIVEVEYELLK